MNFLEQFRLWLEGSFADDKIKEELRQIEDNTNEIEDRFYKNLEFGTAGLRGVIGAGTNRMNILTVGRATQGLANYLIKEYINDISVVIAYDSRLMSKEFAKTAADVLISNGIKAYLFDEIKSTPQLSYAVRYLKCQAGIVITASHNPCQYNGYKVYNSNGGQIIESEANKITEEIANLNYEQIKFTQNIDNSNIITVDKEIDDSYIKLVKELSLCKDVDNNIKIIYTPLHGTGNIPVRRVLDEIGYKNVFVVKEQEKPDSKFSTVKYPNPEDIDAFKLGIKLAKENDADIILATDPDCDRVGVVVKDNNTHEYSALTGNQVGALLVDYILKIKSLNNELLDNSIIINSIVTSDLGCKIAKSYDVQTCKTLTGFKYIADKINELELSNPNTFIFGYEESYGYLYGDFVRDKDAVIASMLIAEMSAYYKKRGKTLIDVLNSLYERHGIFIDEVVSFTVEGVSGHNKISKIIEYFRDNKPNIINGNSITNLFDYKLGIHYDLITGDFDKLQLPKSNVLKFCFEDESWFVIRPSGTEPKIKVYFSLNGKSEQETRERLNNVKTEVFAIMNCIV
ncbi:phospho-sugar mutase [Sedimentibacter sp. zth1]|uniref:phospho-sugar mutase n=1 Tax=Sedimentibacter sp. zth1 TaxID=2816908 RepID=UPI001A922EEB|nr:phospho-sugar mutase [Sedimentibacter sp. zth1]QSX05382.1 phospho-sugar mutase [Sedimentibacter sp. zth1]